MLITHCYCIIFLDEDNYYVYMLKSSTMSYRPLNDNSATIVIRNASNLNTNCHAYEQGTIAHDGLHLFDNDEMQAVLPGPVDRQQQPQVRTCDHLKTVIIPKLNVKVEFAEQEVITL